MNKSDRHRVIQTIASQRAIGTQEEMVSVLRLLRVSVPSVRLTALRARTSSHLAQFPPPAGVSFWLRP